jgi:hypothetical protein
MKQLIARAADVSFAAFEAQPAPKTCTAFRRVVQTGPS